MISTHEMNSPRMGDRLSDEEERVLEERLLHCRNDDPFDVFTGTQMRFMFEAYRSCKRDYVDLQGFE